MQEPYNNKHLPDFDDEIDLTELFRALFQGKWIIISVTSLVSIIGVIYSLSLPNIYESKAILVPADESSSMSSAMKNYGGLAGLAGINLPSGEGVTNSEKAKTKLSSLSFFKNNLLPHIFLPDLMAVKSWDVKTNSVTYDESIYKKNSNTWIREVSYPKQQIPSVQESFKVFRSEHFNISEDKKTGFITLSTKHQSPLVAKEWNELLINEVNSFYRQKDKSESQKALVYLNKQIASVNLSEIKQVIAELMQQETQKLALVEVKQFYVFDYIDPPAVMEQKSEPKRALICIFFAIFGGILSIILLLLRHYIFRKKSS